MKRRITRSVTILPMLAGFVLASRTFGEPPVNSSAGAAKPPVTGNKAQAPAQAQVGPPVPAPAAPQGPTPTVQLKPGEVPKVEFDTPVYDFGKMKSGKDIEHDFWFHNTGNGPLEIVQVKPSCGCTTTHQYDKVVEPGKSGKIPIKVSTGHATGPINKSITVTTNVAGAGATIALQVKGELWESIQATPNNALFGNVAVGQTKDAAVVRKLTIANNTDAPVKLGAVKNMSTVFTGDIKEVEAGKKWELTVTLKMPQPPGVVNGMMELETGVSDPPKLQIPCSAYLVADVDVVPNKMVLPAARTARLQRDFYVRNNGGKPIHLSDLAASNSMLKVGMQETQPGMSFRVTMDVPTEYKAPKDGDKITFKTDNPSYPTITIPITELAAAPAVQAAALTAGRGPSAAVEAGAMNSGAAQSTASPVAASVVPTERGAKAPK